MRQPLARGLTLMTVAGAALLLACTVFPLVLLDTADSPIGWAQDSAWPYLSVTAFVLSGLMPFVMLTVYACQIDETRVLGLTGLVLSLVGFVAYIGFQFDLAFVWPVLAERAPELLDYNGPMFRHPRYAFVHSWMGVLESVGLLLFGIALIRARIFPRSVLFMIGLILSAGLLFPPLVIRAVGGVLAAPAMGWMAVVLWRRTQPASVAT